MHALIGGIARAATSTPSPTPVEPDPILVTPGPWGFVAIAALALVVVLLIWDMLRRIRRGRYRSEVREELDAEERAAQEADEGARGAGAAGSDDGRSRPTRRESGADDGTPGIRRPDGPGSAGEAE